MTEDEMYTEAGRIASIAMGIKVIPGSRGHEAKTVRVADEDPLAWWCLTELLVGFAKRARVVQKREPVKGRGRGRRVGDE